MTGYRADIDGLRAVAVLPVLLYHAGIPPFSGGFMGVDVFFVISGYLICSIIRSEISQGKFSILKFYERRFRRILPALLAMIIPVSIVAVFVLLPLDLADFGRSVAATSVFSSNIYFMLTTDYFSGASDLKALLHTWSLAVEEQFYIVVPLLLLAMARMGRQLVLLCILGASMLSLAACIYVTSTEPDVAFYFPATRVWELGFGAALAYSPSIRAPKGVAEIVSALGILFIAYSVFMLTSGPDFPGYQAALPVIGTVFILWAGGQNSGTLVGRVLSVKPMIFVGKISYSLYLWHWPVLVFASYYLLGELSVSIAWLCLAISFVLATLSYLYVETPFRERRLLGQQRQILSASIAMLIATFVLGYSLTLNGGWQGRTDPNVTLLAQGVSDFNPERNQCHGSGDGKAGPTPEDLIADGPCKIGNSDEPATFILLGDSHAETLRTPLSVIAQDAGITGAVATYTGCPPALGGRADKAPWHRCADFDTAVRQYILASPQISTVILAGFWQTYLDEEVSVDGTLSVENSELAQSLLKTIREYQANGRKVALVRQIPVPGFNVPSAVARRANFGSHVRLEMDLVEYNSIYDMSNRMVDYLSSTTGILVISPTDALCAGENCLLEYEGQSMYSDDDHLSRAGASLLAPLFRPIFGG